MMPLNSQTRYHVTDRKEKLTHMQALFVLIAPGLVAMAVGTVVWYGVHWLQHHDIVKAHYAVINFEELLFTLFIVGLVVGQL